MTSSTEALPPPAAPRYGGFWIRFVAYLIDTLVLGIPFGILFAVMSAAGLISFTCAPAASGFGSTCSPNSAGVVVLYIVLVVVFLLYYPVLWGRGGTLGQRMLGLHVIDATTGAHIGTGRGFLRLVG